MEDLKKILIEGCHNFNISLKDEEIDKFFLYIDLLLYYNEKINLTAITNKKEIIVKHFLDSLSILSIVNIDDEKKIIDIGVGAGFPSIPLKILKNNVSMVLVDSLKKRITFLEELIKQLDLKNVHLIHSRCEELANNNEFRENFDFSLSRAVSNMNTLSEFSLPFLKIGGKFIALKSKNVVNEINNCDNAIKVLGGKINCIEDIKLEDNLIHKIVVIDKISNTPSKYPRKFKKIKSTPL